MKHDLPVTLILMAIFVLSQLIGLAIVSYDIQVSTDEGGNFVVSHPDTALGERPEIYGQTSFLYIVAAIFFGTLLVLLIVKFKKMNLWKLWFFLAVWMTLTLSFGVFVPTLSAYGIALALAVWKVMKPNVIVHNITEVFIYSGIAVMFAPLLNPLWGVILLLGISVYDAFAVWQSKHMVKMAKFQTDSKMFAGLYIPYKLKAAKTVSKKTKSKSKSPAPKKSKRKSAILGGGDIAFPLIFAAVIMESLVINGMPKLLAYGYSLLIPLGAGIGLFVLLLKSKKDRFYPAMPFISAGCLLAYGLILLL